MFNRLKKAVSAALDNQSRLSALERDLQRLRLAIGRIEQRQTAGCATLSGPAEFQVFSQWGEDGIINRLVDLCAPLPPSFIEFGVEDYSEANTRFLLENRNWSGLVIDASAAHVQSIRESPIFWRHTLTAACSFITRENVNRLFRDNGFAGEIGLLSIDIDGMDYWVWDAVQTVTPMIVVCEYNALFGSAHEVTVPYDAGFSRHGAHFSGLYAGASLAALAGLARRKGYRLVCGNSAGNNAFFVRNGIAETALPEMAVQNAYRTPRFREARNADGCLLFPSFEESRAMIRALPVLDLARGHTRPLHEIFAAEAATP